MFSESNLLEDGKQYCITKKYYNTAYLSSSKFCGVFSAMDIYTTDYIRHLETCNIAGDQYMYILCCLFVTLYKLLFLLRVGLIYNMLDDLSFTSYLLYFFKCTQMILVFHRKSSFFFLEIFKLVISFVLFHILQILWDR